MTARTTFLSGEDFSLHAYLSPVRSLPGEYSLTITSQRQSVRNPEEEHVRFFACLDRQGLEALSDFIQQELQAQGEQA